MEADVREMETDVVRARIGATLTSWAVVPGEEAQPQLESGQNNLEFYGGDPAEFQDQQQRQVAALRGFYSEESPLFVVDFDEVDEAVKTVVQVDSSNLGEIAAWLRKDSTWLAFKPTVIEKDARLFLVY